MDLDTEALEECLSALRKLVYLDQCRYSRDSEPYRLATASARHVLEKNGFLKPRRDAREPHPAA